MLRRAKETSVVPPSTCGRSRRGQRGQAVVEMALVVPVALLILALVVDAGQFIVGTINLNQVARAAATAASFSADHGGTTAEVDAQAVNAATVDEPTVVYAYCSAAPVTPPCVTVNQVPAPAVPANCGVPGLPPCLQQITVYQAVVPLVPLFPGMTLQASAAAAY